MVDICAGDESLRPVTEKMGLRYIGIDVKPKEKPKAVKGMKRRTSRRPRKCHSMWLFMWDETLTVNKCKTKRIQCHDATQCAPRLISSPGSHTKEIERHRIWIGP